MYQFIYGSDTAYGALERSAREACVVFDGEQMPQGSRPQHARVGFEVQPDTGSAVLFVGRGVHYPGDDAEIRAWLEAGERQFADFAQLVAWIRHTLGAAYPATSLPGSPMAIRSSTSSSPSSGSPGLKRPEDLTDMSAVHANIESHDNVLFIKDEDLFRALSARVRGQHAALHTVSGVVSRHVARCAPQRPATIFLIGLTGVGKTKTAESLPIALAESCGESANHYSYLRLDMAEYQERHRVSQLLGAPAGYVGYGDGATLVDALAANSHTIVLFDEIEKAHPDVLRMLMGAMDAGRLSVASSKVGDRQIDCRKAIFLFTTNLDATGILGDLTAANSWEDQELVSRLCRNHLRDAGIAPELIGRVRAYAVFQALTPSARAEILTLAVAGVASEYGIQIARIAPTVVSYLLNRSHNMEFGARPDEYAVDEVLGEAFRTAAAVRMIAPVEVCGGPPFYCRCFLA